MMPISQKSSSYKQSCSSAQSRAALQRKLRIGRFSQTIGRLRVPLTANSSLLVSPPKVSFADSRGDKINGDSVDNVTNRVNQKRVHALQKTPDRRELSELWAQVQAQALQDVERTRRPKA